MPSKQVTDREKSPRSVATAAAAIEALAELGGPDDLAAKVKPSGRRAGRTAAEDEPGEPNGGSPAGAPS